jgi:hypothetical protein
MSNELIYGKRMPVRIVEASEEVAFRLDASDEPAG